MSPKLPKRIRNHVNPLSDLTEHTFGGFDTDAPIIVDIGAYRGEFSEALVSHYGEKRNFIVTEIRKPYAKYLSELFTSSSNVAVFDGDTNRILRSLLEPSIKQGREVEYIFINFPDPWFKDRHKKRRVLSQRFISDCKEWLPANTKIVLQTDQEQLFRETQELLDENSIAYTEFTELLVPAQTYWETMKIEEGDTIYRMHLTIQ